MSKIINGVASEYDFPFKDFDVRYDEESMQKFNRWQDLTIEEYKKEIERLNNIIDEIFEWMQNKYDNSDLTGFTVSFQELQDLKELKKVKSKGE